MYTRTPYAFTTTTVVQKVTQHHEAVYGDTGLWVNDPWGPYRERLVNGYVPTDYNPRTVTPEEE